MTNFDSVLANGVFGATSGAGEFDALAELARDLGQRSAAARVGRRQRPDNFDGQLWDALVASGLDRLTSDADNEAGPAELAVVLYWLARNSATVPIAETDLLAAWLMQCADIEVPNGVPLTAGRAVGTARGRVVSGVAATVPWGSLSTRVVLVEAREPGADDGTFHIGLADPSDAVITAGMNLAGEPRDDIAFAIASHKLHQIEPAVADEYECRGAWARCIQMIGALDAAAESSVRHCRERVQFGRPLSKLQSVQHTLATMAGEIERARAAVTLAVAAATDFGFADTHTEYAVSVAKAVLGPVVSAVTGSAHQLHGAIGTSIEHGLWPSTLRARSWVDEFGSVGHHARRVGRTALGAAAIWDCVTCSRWDSPPVK